MIIMYLKELPFHFNSTVHSPC